MKRIFKGPLIWIVVAVVGVLIAMQFLLSSGGGDEISASQMNEYIADGEVKEITFVDGDQVRSRRRWTTSVDRDGGREVTTKWLDRHPATTSPRRPSARSTRARSRSRPSRSPAPAC